MYYFYNRMPIATADDLVSYIKTNWINFKMTKENALKIQYKLLPYCMTDNDKKYAYCYVIHRAKDRFNLNTAFSLINDLVRDKYVPAYVLLGNAYYYGWGTPKNTDKAFEWYLKAHNAGYAVGTFNCALSYYDKKDFPTMRKYIDLAISMGYPQASRLKGDGYLYGRYGYPENEAKAIEYYNQASNLGCELAQYRLGVCYKNGYGVPVNHTKALDYFEKAAMFDIDDAQLKVAVYYLDGIHIRKFPEKAIYYLELAVELENYTAMALAGHCYMQGIGCDKDYFKGMELIRKSALKGDELGKKYLAKYNI